MSFGGALLALTAVEGISQIGQGYAERAEANFNSSLLNGKAGMIDVQKDIEAGQYARMEGNAIAKSTANMAKMGVGMSGSPLAAMVDTVAQIKIDRAIGQFNYEQEKNYTKAEADAMRRKGKLAVQSGWTNGFTTALKGYSNYQMYKNGINEPIKKINTTGRTSLDYSYKPVRMGGGISRDVNVRIW